MGHGKGYYDEFLSNLINFQPKPPRTVALAFREQVLENIPHDDKDVIIDQVIFPDDDVQ